MTIQDYAAIATSAFTLITAIFIGWQVRKMSESLTLSRVEMQHTLCVEVWKQFNDVFEDRQELLRNPIRLELMLSEYVSISALIDSEEYKKLKRVAGIYVLAGALVDSGAISPKVIFNYISAPTAMWDEHRPLVEYLRKNYYPNLWIHWESLVALESNLWTPTPAALLDKSLPQKLTIP